MGQTHSQGYQIRSVKTASYLIPSPEINCTGVCTVIIIFVLSCRQTNTPVESEQNFVPKSVKSDSVNGTLLVV